MNSIIRNATPNQCCSCRLPLVKQISFITGTSTQKRDIEPIRNHAPTATDRNGPPPQADKTNTKEPIEMGSNVTATQVRKGETNPAKHKASIEIQAE